VADFTKD